MTMMTEATPITTPMSVRMVRSLFAHSDCSASLKASMNGMALLSFAEPAMSLRVLVQKAPANGGAQYGSCPVITVYEISAPPCRPRTACSGR